VTHLLRSFRLLSPALCLALGACAPGTASAPDPGEEAALSAGDEYVTSPTSGEATTSPLWIRAHVVSCGGKASTSFGYSIDDETAFHAGVTKNDIDTVVDVAAGTHTLHVKAWSPAGACNLINVPFTAESSSAPPPPTSPFTLPSSATSSSGLESSASWKWNDDPGTSGSASGTSSYGSAPGGDARAFHSTYSSGGGEIFHLSFANDPNATHFVYDNYVYVTDPGSLANLEMDMNQVLSNGDTIIYGFQCSHYSKTWEYTLNDGTPSAPKDHWHPSNVACDPTTWSANAWHHVQIAYHRDSSGNVTYDAVALDGKASALTGASGPSAFALGWAKGVLLTNFQLDGLGASGAITAYAKDLTISRW